MPTGQLAHTWTYLTYSIGFLVEHMASATVLHRTQFCAVRSSSPQVTLHAFISSLHDIRHNMFYIVQPIAFAFSFCHL